MEAAMADLLDLGPGEAPAKRSSYPHMMPEDHVVWSRFLEQKVGLVQRVWYDVHVGEAVEVPNDLPPEMLAVSRAVTRKRIDAVCIMGGVYYVCEVKPWGGYVALGQVLVYWDLFIKEFPRASPTIGAVVCATADPDCLDAFGEQGIDVFVVGLG
jgi:hypothetical protein